MAIKIDRSRKKPKWRRKCQDIGFSNRLALYTLLFLATGLVGGFYLALKSIQYQYTGALVCWTVMFTPIGTAVGSIPCFVVHKSTVENSRADGEGIKFATTKAAGFEQEYTGVADSPEIWQWESLKWRLSHGMRNKKYSTNQ